MITNKFEKHITYHIALYIDCKCFLEYRHNNEPLVCDDHDQW